MGETKNLTKINRERPYLRIVKRMIQVSQGENTIYLTKNDVNALRMLKEGQFDGTYTSNIKPCVRYTLLKDGSILAVCKDVAHDDAVYISTKTLKMITEFRDNNRPRLAWDKELTRRRC